MKSNIRKWGNSTALIIPAAALAESNLKLGDAVDIEARQGDIAWTNFNPSPGHEQANMRPARIVPAKRLS